LLIREVGGEVVFQCNSIHNKTLKSLTFQKRGGEALYEYRTDNKPTKENKNESIIGNYTERTVTIKNLTVSDEGEYECITKSDGNSETHETEICLKIEEPGKPPCPSLNQALDNNIGLIHIE